MIPYEQHPYKELCTFYFIITLLSEQERRLLGGFKRGSNLEQLLEKSKTLLNFNTILLW